MQNKDFLSTNGFGFQTEAASEFPRMVIAGISFACNARCPHCIYAIFPETKEKTSRKSPKKVFMDLETFKKIADECSVHKNTLLRLVGFGEPMLNPDFFEILKYSKGKGCNVGVITNGSLLDAERAKKLLDTDIDAIDISVDAINKETYEKVRAGLNFDKLRENVKGLVDLRNKMCKKTFIFCSIVEQKEVMDELDAALKYWGSITDKAVSRKFLTFGLFKFDNDRKPYYTKRVPCFLLFDRINVDLNGIIRLCGYDSYGETNLGNTGESSSAIYDAWHSDKLNRIRENHISGKLEKERLCGRCEDWPFHS